ncbi:MAG: hypothetical protein ABJP45_01250 [Cyclobacteriaceae bacterium]
MKRFKNVALIPGMIVMLGLLSCSKDDGDTVSAGSDIVFDGKTYAMVDGLISDYGSYEPLDGEGTATHYNFDFDIVDAALVTITDSDGDTYQGAGDATTIHVYVELFAPSTTSFSAGTYEYVNDETATPADIAGKFVFFSGEVELDSDGVENGDLDGPEYEINGGTVTITGTNKDDFAITFNVTTSGGKTLTGSYSGEFDFQDDTD